MAPEGIWNKDNWKKTLQQEQPGQGHEQIAKAPAPHSDAPQEQYNYYYNRIYPLLKDGLLDFQRIAGKTGLKERRIRETLLFRLTTSEVMQLFGRKTGFCYICGYKTHSPSSKEPVCMNCLKALDTAIQEIHLAEITQRQIVGSTFEIPSINTLPDPDDATMLFADLPPTAFEKQAPEFLTVSELEYQQNLAELIRYRAIYGPLPPLEEDNPDKEEAVTPSHELFPEIGTASSTDQDTSNPLSKEDNDPFLQMLDLDDREIQDEGLEHPMPPELFSNSPIRHFGFERLKGGDT